MMIRVRHVGGEERELELARVHGNRVELRWPMNPNLVFWRRTGKPVSPNLPWAISVEELEKL